MSEVRTVRDYFEKTLEMDRVDRPSMFVTADWADGKFLVEVADIRAHEEWKLNMRLDSVRLDNGELRRFFLRADEWHIGFAYDGLFWWANLRSVEDVGSWHKTDSRVIRNFGVRVEEAVIDGIIQSLDSSRGHSIRWPYTDKGLEEKIKEHGTLVYILPDKLILSVSSEKDVHFLGQPESENVEAASLDPVIDMSIEAVTEFGRNKGIFGTLTPTNR